MSWPEEPFEDLLSERIRNGIYKSAEHRGFGNPIVKMGELFANEVISDDAYDRVSLTDRDLRTATLAEGDLLFARRSYVLAGSGKCSIVGQLSEPTCFESSVIRARPDRARVVPRFLYYFFKSPYGRARMASIATRTAVSGIRGTDLAKLPVPCPDLELQRKIAAVLAAYDELIENNLRRIEILEEMAEAVYREWFVNFRFPGHEDVALVDSPLGPIPEGWEASTLGQWVEFAYGRALKADDRRGGDVPVLGSSGVVGWHDEGLVPGPGVVVGRKGNVGSVHWVDTDFCPIDTTFYVVSDLPLHYLVHNLRQQNFINSDAAVPGLNRNQAYANPFVVPAIHVLKRFVNVVEPTTRLIRNLRNQNANLRATRDLLLPKLVSGEIDVSELDIDTEWLAS